MVFNSKHKPVAELFGLVLRQVHGRDDAAKVIKPAVASLVDEALP